MNIIQLEDAKNLKTDNMICKGPDGRDIWKVKMNLPEAGQVEVERTVVTDQPVAMRTKMSYKDIASGNWYSLDPQEFERMAKAPHPKSGF